MAVSPDGDRLYVARVTKTPPPDRGHRRRERRGQLHPVTARRRLDRHRADQPGGTRLYAAMTTPTGGRC